jgi:hypothetical protein
VRLQQKNHQAVAASTALTSPAFCCDPMIQTTAAA